MSAFLFSDHEADDLVVRLAHAVLPEHADAADSAFDVFHDDPVSALELLAVLVHVESQDAGVHGEYNLGCAGCLGAVADNTGSDGKRIDHSVDDRLYDTIGDKAEGKVVLVTERGVLCKVCKKSLAKQNGQAEE